MSYDNGAQPRDASDWSNWFWNDYFGAWLARVQDGQNGVFDALNADGTADVTAGKSVLAQARTLFTLSHVALLSGDTAHIDAARQQAAFLRHYCKAPGLYRCNANRDGSPTGKSADEIARSYDQTFVILGLVTWHKLAPSNEVAVLISECWNALQTHLRNPQTGLLRNDDSADISNPAQNPHMHLYEACLQAYRMTGVTIWLTRAADLRMTGLKQFMDPQSGSIAEFVTPSLQPLPGDAGQRREIGHQCEWAWLLLEEAALANKPELRKIAARLSDFAQAHGFATRPPLTGAAFDAVSTSGTIVEHSFLLWPQTEAIKLLALHHLAGDPKAADKARALLCLVFERYFADRPCYVNQLDTHADVIWDQALTRLMYHFVLAMTEGAKAGLWPDVPSTR
ncbi:mannose-6-phosphate isomerase [Yoonia tamlensis]|uniref:Mannose-6-phosphate isomerase n=1 Tax=Yoonia tamlensis TaxID=390270 RepID=A0A1I6GNA9_9RHOB|nr:AGE family epimerase/isomerase [Yoonia tamlensis]SFR43722.1 mannose-6-phosphate isomerase [Yoonia tamlensis]